MDFFYSIVSFFGSGGIFMYPILLVFAVGVAIAVERYVTLSMVTNKNKAVWEKVQPLLTEGQFDEAREHGVDLQISGHTHGGQLDLRGLRGLGPAHPGLRLQLGPTTLIVSRGGQEIDLNPIGLKLLRCLMEASPNVVTRTELEKEVWGEEMPDSDSLRVHIHSLRAAIDKPFGSKMIQTRHGIGYRLLESNAVQT